MEVLFRGGMFLIGITLMALGYSLLAHLDYYWQRYATRLRAKGSRPTRTPKWDQQRIVLGFCLILIGFVCIPFWFFTPFT